MADQTPYDCRANHKAVFDDISLSFGRPFEKKQVVDWQTG